MATSVVGRGRPAVFGAVRTGAELTAYTRFGRAAISTGIGARRSSTRIASENRSTEREVATCSRRRTQFWTR